MWSILPSAGYASRSLLNNVELHVLYNWALLSLSSCRCHRRYLVVQLELFDRYCLRQATLRVAYLTMMNFMFFTIRSFVSSITWIISNKVIVNHLVLKGTILTREYLSLYITRCSRSHFGYPQPKCFWNITIISRSTLWLGQLCLKLGAVARSPYYVQFINASYRAQSDEVSIAWGL